MYITFKEYSLNDRIFLFLHTIRLHQMVYQLSLVIMTMFVVGSYTNIQLISSLAVILLITPTFLLLNDVLHRQDDEKVGQNRILFSKKTNSTIFKVNLSVISILLLFNSVFALFFYYALFITTLIYGYAKYRRLMYLSYAGRFISGIMTFLLYYSIFSINYDVTILIIGLIVGVYDLTGNIAGDLRDHVKDQKAGIHTIVTKFSQDFAIKSMIYLTIIVYSLLTFILQIKFVIILFIINMMVYILIDNVKVKYRHGLIHGSKCIFFILLGGLLVNQIVVLSNVVLGIGSLWIVSYYLYLQR